MVKSPLLATRLCFAAILALALHSWIFLELNPLTGLGGNAGAAPRIMVVRLFSQGLGRAAQSSEDEMKESASPPDPAASPFSAVGPTGVNKERRHPALPAEPGDPWSPAAASPSPPPAVVKKPAARGGSVLARSALPAASAYLSGARLSARTQATWRHRPGLSREGRPSAGNRGSAPAHQRGRDGRRRGCRQVDAEGLVRAIGHRRIRSRPLFTWHGVRFAREEPDRRRSRVHALQPRNRSVGRSY